VIVGGVAGSASVAAESRRQQAEARRILAEGQEAEGAVTRLWWSGGKSASDGVDYRFTADGREYHGSAKIARRRWNSLEAGGPIAVRYLPSGPAHNYPSGDPPDVMPSWGAFLLGFVCAALGARWLFPVWRAWRYLARGRPAPAVVTRVETRGAARRGAANKISYEFPLPGGGTCRRRCGVNSSPPLEGSVICVLCDPDNPHRHIRYPSGLVKVAMN
jgi:hypothetical protein